MKGRRGDSDDSLDLLLDTICNMFGTIIFVALIAALLALTSTKGSPEPSLVAGDPDGERQMALLAARAEELERELSALPAAAEATEDSAAAERVAEALGEIARREELIDRYSEAVAAVTDDLARIGAQVAPLREEVARLESALDGARRAKDRTMRTPLERALELRLYSIVIWEDRLYPLCDWSNGTPDTCARFEQWDDRYVVAAASSLDGDCRGMNASGFTRTIPLRQGAGIPIADTASLLADPRFREMLAALDPSEDMVLLDVAPDSFDSFNAVKEALLGAGFNYTLSACTAPLPRYRDRWIPGTPRGL
jgi:hypothetical protein